MWSPDGPRVGTFQIIEKKMEPDRVSGRHISSEASCETKREVGDVGSYEFDINGMNDTARAEAADAASKILHMSENAGHIQAADMLRARDHFDTALRAWIEPPAMEGWGNLPTGEDVSKQYKESHQVTLGLLTSMRATCQQLADHFLAMEMLYLNTEERNGRRINPYKDGKTTVQF